jgi:predicted  nucleic acid-binding Zn-ribbon protein
MVRILNDDEKVMLVESDQRSKSAIHQIDEVKDRLDKLEDKTEDIHRIATSIEVVCNDIGYIKQGQVDLTTKVDKLSDKVDSQIQEIKSDVEIKVGKVDEKVGKLEREPYEEFKKTKHEIKVNVWGAIVVAIAMAALGGFFALVSTGTIKL